MNAIQKHILSIGLMLAIFAIGSSSLVVITENATHDKIADNERQTLLNAINALVPAANYNNDILSDTLEIAPTKILSTTKSTTVYRARQNQQAVAAVFTSIAPNGYNGKITLLVGVYHTGKLAGVRVITHKETPGLGDKIDERKSDWITQFSGLSLNNPGSSQWSVKKDGGQFDQFTGATITPRAVIQAIKNALHYFEQHQNALFKQHPENNYD
jgi:electron transport complex protein RnfG